MAEDSINYQKARIRSWVFTWNNYSEEDVNRLTSTDYLKDIGVKYLLFGREHAPTTNTPHLQGYVYFYDNILQSELFTRFKGTFWCRKARGTPKQNLVYSGKEDKEPFQWGVPPKGQGKRTDIDVIKQAVKDHLPINEIIFNHATSYQSMKCAELLFKYAPQPKCQKRLVKWYYGQTGSGKTSSAIKECEDKGLSYWMTAETLKWWDGYFGQQVVIIDEFRGDMAKYHWLLRLLDSYPVRVETKGSSIYLQPSTEMIIITSAFHPRKVFCTLEDINQLLRRVDEIKEFGQHVPTPDNSCSCIGYNCLIDSSESEN